MKTVSKILTLALTLFALGMSGARAEASGDIQDKLRVLLASLQSPVGNFLAGQEAMSFLDTAKAADFLSSASLQAPDNFALILRTFHAEAANGQIEDAAKTARHLLELAPNDELSQLVIGTVALKQRRYKAAITELDNIKPRSFIGITATIIKAWAFVGDNRYEAATAVLDSLSEDGIEDFLTYHRALMADVADRRDAALEYAKTAYETESYDVRFVGAYTRMLANASRFDEAEKIINAYRAEGLSDPSVLALETDIRAGRRPGKLAPTAQHGAAEMFNSIGGALTNDGTADVAAIYLRIALYLEPGFDLSAMQLGQLYQDNGQFEVANAIYRALPDSSPYKREAKVREAQNIATAGDRKEAILRLNQIVNDDPENLEAMIALANMLRTDERYEEASDAYSQVIGLVGGDHPQDWRYYYLRGMCYERAKNWPLAEKDFLRALELDPGNPQVLNYLGYSWIDQGTHLDEALDMIKKALEWDPTDGYVVDSLGWAYFRLGRYDDAVTTLEQAVQLRASDAAINDHLGDAYWRAGRKLEARFQWTIAADLEPESEIGKLARKKLTTGLDDAATTVSNG